ncbi:(2Fe-2S)-binding protein [Rhodococcus chondri]|uniref:(2Fe-2S)-binding protein n=1 Tax=Rhodococcus chondri TaxID=3065941 RepID=A0ABU7JSF6_9NOCA|nr:(2Fe-2S)-binding protein [Rhodococcus sp. CC-R104]MEE2032951.1 (2Fe-2S)-binding protein [Rhodococcus sp. CC-R104]
MSDAIALLARIATLTPYFAVSTGPVSGEDWQPTSTLRDTDVRNTLVSAVAERMGTTEMRVAASTVFFGYAARLWSVAIGSVAVSGRCIRLDPGELLWRGDGSITHLHIERPRFGESAAVEVLDRQVGPLIAAWGDVVAPGLMWGNTASALAGAGRMIGDAASPLVDALLDEPRLRESLDRSTGRRRSCCLFYRTPSGGMCGDCVFPSRPPA